MIAFLTSTILSRNCYNLETFSKNSFLFQGRTTGQDLLDFIYKYLNLLETAYFGLRYQDNSNQTVNRLSEIKTKLIRIFSALA